MRWSLLLLVLVIPAIALAKPKVAVAPLDGDNDGKIAEVVVEAAAEHSKVTKPDRVQRDMEKLSVTSFDNKAVKRLRNKLEVDVVIHGKVSKKRLELTIAGKGKNKSKLELDFKNTKALKKELAAKLGKRIDDAAAAADDDDDDDDEAKKREEEARREETRKREEDDRRKKDEDDRKRADDDRRKRDDDDRKRTSKRDDDRGKRTSKRDDDDDSVRRRSEDEDEDDDDRSSRKRRRGDREDKPRNAVTQAALWLDAGAALARRTFTYDSTGATPPPAVGTAAPAGRVEGEVYPAAFSTLKGGAAGFGIAGTYNRTFALGIAVPGTTVTTPIQNGFYSVGARYRFTFAGASVAAGIAYWARYFMADRRGLMMANQLDMPDVYYKAVAPQLVARFPLTPKVGGYVMVDVPLMFDAGPIQKGDNYGSGKLTSFEVRGGAQIMLGPHYALQINADYGQVNMKFDGSMGTQAALRGVTATTDTNYGLAVTLGVLY